MTGILIAAGAGIFAGILWLLAVIGKTWKIPDNSMDTPTVPTSPHEDPIGPIETPQEMVVRVCTEEKLTPQEIKEVCATIKCESGFNNSLTHKNIVNGKVTSIDYGICQINDFYHVGPGKDFPSIEYVMQNPEECVRWMARLWKAGKKDLWVCWKQKLVKL